jgi:hypothetical protein
MHIMLSLPMNMLFHAGQSENVRASLNKSHIMTTVNILITRVVTNNYTFVLSRDSSVPN